MCAGRHPLQRLAGQHMDVQGWVFIDDGARFRDLDISSITRARHRLLPEAAYAAAGLYQRLEIHPLHSQLLSGSVGAAAFRAAAASTSRAHFSPIMMEGALVLPLVSVA